MFRPNTYLYKVKHNGMVPIKLNTK